MTREELFNEIKALYPDAVMNFVSDKYNFPSRPSFIYIPSRDLYIDIFDNEPHFWVEEYDVELHPEGDEAITQSDEFMNKMMHIAMGQDEDADAAQAVVDFWLSDMEKRKEAAKSNNLNYVVFWDSNLDDAKLWIAMGCPDGRDYEREYSWIPEHDILDYPLRKFTGKPSNLSQIVKHFQFFEFFWRELALWYNNDSYKSHGRLQGFLYANRYKYINKLPNELTTAEILRGLTISGVLRGYTTFDAKLMYEIIDKYDIKSVYDPCAGWGERMLACHHKNIAYTGVDINPGLICGYENMIDYYRIKNTKFINDDSSEYEPSDLHDAVITCPPYGDIEYYCDLGAENLSYYKFFEWWEKVIKNCSKANPKYFCFQINTKYRDDMLAIVESAGYKLIDELYFKSNKSSHFNRKKDGVNLKTEKESMLILEKI